LKDAEFRIDFHPAHKFDNGVCGHVAVGVQNQREVVIITPPLTEVLDVACLEAGVFRPAAINDLHLTAKALGHSRSHLLLVQGDIVAGGVAQDIEFEMRPLFCADQVCDHGAEVGLKTLHVFVANAGQKRC